MEKDKLKQEVHEARGVIVLVQEDRFRMETKDGLSLLLILGNGSRSSIEDLEKWASSSRRVHVRYRGVPEAGAVALEVRPE